VQREALVGHLGGRQELVDAGVVDEDVDLAGFAGQPFDVAAVGEVGADEASRPAVGDDLVDTLAAAQRISAVDGDVGAVGSELLGDGAPDPGGRAGDEGGLSRRSCHFGLLVSSRLLD